MGCCSSRPVDSEDALHDRPPQPQVRESPQAVTSETNINSTATRQARSLEPTSTTSRQPSDTSRSRNSTPRGSTNREQSSSQPVDLAEHYNVPLQAPKVWKCKNRTWNRTQLQRERYEFFETRVTGRREIWAALKQVAECIREGDLVTAQGILDAVGVTLPTGRMEEGGYDENGNLYRVSEAVLSDPTNMVDEDGDDQTVIGIADTKELSKLDDDESKVLAPEPTHADKGKAVVDKNSIKVKCRLSDRGGPDVIVLLGRTQTVGLLSRRVRDDGDVPIGAGIRIAYLGQILDEKKTLLEQGWKEGHVVNALVSGVYSS